LKANITFDPTGPFPGSLGSVGPLLKVNVSRQEIIDVLAAFGVHIGDIRHRPHPKMEVWIPKLNEELLRAGIGHRSLQPSTRREILSSMVRMRKLQSLQRRFLWWQRRRLLCCQ
jgi:hypothetical protein